MPASALPVGERVEVPSTGQEAEVTYHSEHFDRDVVLLEDGTVRSYLHSALQEPAGPPTAAVTVEPQAPKVGQPVTFKSAGTCAAAPCKYDWRHATTSFGSGETATFTYAGPGQKTVTLLVTDAQGRTATVNRSITVEAAPAPVTPPTAPSNTAYPVPAGATEFRSENFESGRTNWLTQAPAGRFTVQNSTAGEGSFSARTEVRPGDPQVASGNRAEISGASHANDELCYGGRFMVPSASTTGSSTWQITYQWHAGSGSPPLALMVTERPGGTFDLKLGHGNSSRTDWTKTGLARDVWHSMFVCVKWGTSGWLEFWFDGAWQTIGPAGPRGVPRKTFATNPVSSSIYWKGGVYRSPTSTGTTIRYIDDLRAFEM